MKFILAILMIFLLPAARGAALVLSGVLHRNGTQEPPIPSDGQINGLLRGPTEAGLETSGDGSFFLVLSGNTLNYHISTGSLGNSFDPSQAGLMLGLPSGNLDLPILSYKLIGVSGCGLYFAAYDPLSYLTESITQFFPLGIYMPPGNCRAFFQFSILTGNLELTPGQAALFAHPDFALSSPSLGLYGRTGPNVVPEPKVMMLAAAAGLILLRRRTGEPRSGSPMNSRGFQPPVRTTEDGFYPGGVGLTPRQDHRAWANPSGVLISFRAFRGFRSFLASPPAVHGEPLRGWMPGQTPGIPRAESRLHSDHFEHPSFFIS